MGSSLHSPPGEHPGFYRAIDLIEELSPPITGELGDILLGSPSLALLATQHVKVTELNAAISRLNAAVKAPEQLTRRSQRLAKLGSLLRLRYQHHSEQSDIAAAIDYLNQAFELTPKNDPNMVIYADCLVDSLYARYERTGNIININRAIDVLNQAVQSVLTESRKLWICLTRLGLLFLTRHTQTESFEDADMGTDYLRQALVHCPENNPRRHVIFKGLGELYRSRFDHSSKLDDLEASIVYHQMLLKCLPDQSVSRGLCLSDCGKLYYRRSKELQGAPYSMAEASYFARAIPLLNASPRLQMVSYDEWTEILFEMNDSAPLEAFDQAMKVVQQAASLGCVTVQQRRSMTRLLIDPPWRLPQQSSLVNIVWH
ncbi:NADPH-dependent conjugated polyketone reductase C1 [Ceratobasidium sp. AG-Ba]|nr:NADPH-dependent conjugated polyketone reductase C1 [Ceratobasidium sp. AG-Ba]